MKISVIVPAYNEEKLLAKSAGCIQTAFGAFDRLAWEHELIVCDNNSTDRTAELARSAGATVVFEPVNQISRARNRGAAAATGDWLVFIDADSYPSAELFGEVAAAIQTGRCVAGGCLVRPDGWNFPTQLFVQVWNVISRLTRWAAGSFIFCEASAFRRIGGFNLDLFVTEEIDLSKRLKQLAQETGKQMVILRRHPLMTSDRKLKLYSAREVLRFSANMVFRPKHTLKDRAACHPWYDGRR
ncbi:MAG: glycosyltransferase [Verrucomicrobia bacterium]|nr:glycosyltransferase [Verrucomicrobiota bacterium]